MKNQNETNQTVYKTPTAKDVYMRSLYRMYTSFEFDKPNSFYNYNGFRFC